jgi:hypothetical protein
VDDPLVSDTVFLEAIFVLDETLATRAFVAEDIFAFVLVPPPVPLAGPGAFSLPPLFPMMLEGLLLLLLLLLLYKALSEPSSAPTNGAGNGDNMRVVVVVFSETRVGIRKLLGIRKFQLE